VKIIETSIADSALSMDGVMAVIGEISAAETVWYSTGYGILDLMQLSYHKARIEQAVRSSALREM
jgi:hypothetical protein